MTIPFFALVLIGFLAARLRLLPLEAVPGLTSYVLYFALSAMLFQLGARTPVRQLLDPTLLGVWLVAGLLVMGLAVAVGRRSGKDAMDASMGGLIAVLPNSGFMGLPLITALVGSAAAGPIITSLLVDIVAMTSIAIALAQRSGTRASGAGAQVRAALLRVAKNPMPWAIVLGAAWGMTDRQLSAPLDQVLSMLAASATPVALFTIGAVLARERMGRVSGRRGAGDVPWLAAIKLGAHPLAVWLLGRAAIAAGLPLEESVLVVLVLVAALPSATNASMLAERLGADNGRIASVILLTTVLGFATFTLAVSLLL